MSSHLQTLSPVQKRALLASLLDSDAAEASGRRRPLSFAQERIWFVEQLRDAAATHSLVSALRLSGSLDRNALDRAYTNLIARHEILRTSYESRGGTPEGIVNGAAPAAARVEDLSGAAAETKWADAQAALQQAVAEPSDLSDSPLARLHLIVLGDEDHILALVVPHIASDGASLEVLFDELGAFYTAEVTGRAAELPEPELQYGDFAEWQRTRQQRAINEGLKWWTEALSGMPTLLELPSDRPRPPLQDATGGSVSLQIPAVLARGATAMAAHEHTTIFSVLLAALAIVIHRYTGEEDFCIGLPLSGRSDVDTERMVGLLVNTVPLRMRVSGRQRFVDVLRTVRDAVLDAQAHQDVPFEQVIKAVNPPRTMAHSPLFQMMATALRAPGSRRVFGPLACAPFPIRTVTSPLDQTHYWIEHPDGTWWWHVEYQTALFDAARVWRMVEHAQLVLGSALDHPDRQVSQVPMLTPAEREICAAVRGLDAPIPDRPVHELIWQRAALAPDRAAIVHSSGNVSYAELMERAREIARELRAAGVRGGDRVIVRLARGPELVAALLGVWEARATYVAVDPSHPESRVRLILEDAAARAIVEPRPGSRLATIAPLRDDVAPSDPAAAYVCYTSGSTGKPKGVVVSHRALVNVLNSFRRTPGFSPDDAMLAVTTIGFDIAMLELFLPLVVGGRTIIAPQEFLRDGAQLLTFAAARGATVMQATPATWRLLVDAGWDGSNPPLRAWTGGDTLAAELADALATRAPEVWNLYGPTETTIWSSLARVRRGVPPSVGRPIDNTGIRVLDANREPVPLGTPGEAYITGAGLADGYWARPDLTAERFVTLEDGTRAYRTGDLVRIQDSGEVQHLTRIDRQVKLRGFRVELGEVEHVISSDPAVSECVVTVREDVPGEQRLVAYVVAADGATLDPSVLHDTLTAALPSYMVPALVTLPALPLTPNGKVDRAALPRPAVPAARSSGFGPRDEVEARLARIWREVLGLEAVAIDDDFFNIGGHSMLAVRVFAAIASEFDVTLPLSTLFHDPTVASLARAVREHRAGAEPSLLVPIATGGHRAPLFVGGSDPVYKQLARLLGDDLPVYKMDLYARAEMLVASGRQPHVRFDDYVSEFALAIRAVQPKGPYRLGGGCDGGVLALAVARQLQAAGEEVSVLAIWDTPRTGFFERSWARRARHLARRAGLALLSGHLPVRAERPAGDPATLSPAEQMHLFLYNSYWAAIRQFRHEAPFHGRIQFLEADEQYGDMLPTATGWHELATGGIERHRMPGSHDTYAREHLPAFANLLRRILDSA